MAKKKKIKIPKSVLDLRLTPKQYAKKHGIKLKGKHVSKKERKYNLKKLKKEYTNDAIDGLNKAVKIMADNKISTKKMDKVKKAVDNILLNPDVMHDIAKLYKKHPENFSNMIYLPHMIVNTINYYGSANLDDEEKETAAKMNVDEMLAFCEKILKKITKRYCKLGLDKGTAFCIAAAVPTSRLLKVDRQRYRILTQTMYDRATNNDVDVDEILRAVPKIDKKHKLSKSEFLEGFYSEFIMRKSSSKVKTFTDTQRELHETLVEGALSYLDGLKPRKLREILRKYIKRRKTAESYKTDTKRVIKFTDHANSNSPYSTIKSVVQELIADNSSNEMYLS